MRIERQLLVAFAVAVAMHRLLISTLRHFTGAFAHDVLGSVVPGVMADIAVVSLAASAVVALGVVGRRSRGSGRQGAVVGAALGSLVGLVFAAHLRVVEFFGWSLTPEHTHLVKSYASVRMGLAFLVDSWRPWLLWIAVVVALLAFPLFRRRPASTDHGAKGHPALKATLLLALASTLFLGSERLADLLGSHQQLRTTPVVQVVRNLVEYRLANPELGPPDASDRVAVRQAFDEGRSWSDPNYPLWQAGIWPGRPADGEVEAQRRELAQFLAEGVGRHGPWNVVIVQLESTRANEISSFGPVPKEYEGATPNLDRRLSEGVRFDNVMATGDLTHYGELAMACSLYAIPFHNVILNDPMTPLTCLSDVFRQRGFDTYFACGTDPSTNSRNRLYPFHGVDHLISLQDAPPDAPKEAWGLTDAATYDLVLERLSAVKGPFYAHVLTLSNHIPRGIPPDMPAELRLQGGSDPRLSLLRYTDWAFENFYAKLIERHPHTLVWLTADHGEWPDAGAHQRDPTFDEVKRYHRIPSALLVPELPKPVAGAVFSRLGSDTDLAPTLLNLLGMTDVANQFMGEDLFRRREGIVIKWGETWRRVSANGLEHFVSPAWPRSERLTWGALSRNRLLAPPATSNTSN